jgi:hypothetical protein
LKKDKKGKKGKRGDGDDDGLPTELIETVKAQGDSEVADLVLVVEGVVFVDELVRELGSLRVALGLDCLDSLPRPLSQ